MQNSIIELTDEQLDEVCGGFADTNLGLNLQTLTTGPNISLFNTGTVLQNSGANRQGSENSILDNNGVLAGFGALNV